MPSRKPHKDSVHNQPLRASLTEWAIETVKTLPKHCTTTQEKRKLVGIVKLNHLVAKAHDALEKAA